MKFADRDETWYSHKPFNSHILPERMQTSFSVSMQQHSYPSGHGGITTGRHQRPWSVNYFVKGMPDEVHHRKSVLAQQYLEDSNKWFDRTGGKPRTVPRRDCAETTAQESPASQPEGASAGSPSADVERPSFACHEV